VEVNGEEGRWKQRKTIFFSLSSIVYIDRGDQREMGRIILFTFLISAPSLKYISRGATFILLSITDPLSNRNLSGSN
jgi:hypothetical protein